jgi:hypothetical protein
LVSKLWSILVNFRSYLCSYYNIPSTSVLWQAASSVCSKSSSHTAAIIGVETKDPVLQILDLCFMLLAASDDRDSDRASSHVDCVHTHTHTRTHTVIASPSSLAEVIFKGFEGLTHIFPHFFFPFASFGGQSLKTRKFKGSCIDGGN